MWEGTVSVSHLAQYHQSTEQDEVDQCSPWQPNPGLLVGTRQEERPIGPIVGFERWWGIHRTPPEDKNKSELNCKMRSGGVLPPWPLSQMDGGKSFPHLLVQSWLWFPRDHCIFQRTGPRRCCLDTNRTPSTGHTNSGNPCGYNWGNNNNKMVYLCHKTLKSPKKNALSIWKQIWKILCKQKQTKELHNTKQILDNICWHKNGSFSGMA